MVNRLVSFRGLQFSLPLRAALLVLMAITILSCAQEPGASISSLDWHPRLDQPIHQLGDMLTDPAQLQDTGDTSANLGLVLDAKLYLVFERYLAALPAERRAAAIGEQREWLLERRQARNQAFADYSQGAYAAFAGNRTFNEMTERRVAELERQMGTRSVTDN